MPFTISYEVGDVSNVRILRNDGAVEPKSKYLILGNYSLQAAGGQVLRGGEIRMDSTPALDNLADAIVAALHAAAVETEHATVATASAALRVRTVKPKAATKKKKTAHKRGAPRKT